MKEKFKPLQHFFRIHYAHNFTFATEREHPWYGGAHSISRQKISYINRLFVRFLIWYTALYLKVEIVFSGQTTFGEARQAGSDTAHPHGL